METKEIAVEGPLTIAGTKVYVISEVQITCTRADSSLACSAARRPLYIVIRSGSETTAFTVQGEEVAREQLIKDVAGIEELLDG